MTPSTRPNRWKYDRVLDDETFDDVNDDTETHEQDDQVFGTDGGIESLSLSPHPRHRHHVDSTVMNAKSAGSTTTSGASLQQTTYRDDATLTNTPHRQPSEDNDYDPYEPSARDMATLRRVPDKLPWSAFLVAVVELCERFTYYGLSGPFQNYISNKYKDKANPGALGLGQTGATALTNFFQFWCYVTPLIGAWVADEYLGKYKTIVYFSMIYLMGLVILFATSLPAAIEAGAALGGLIVAMIVIGLGTGGIKSNVSPLIAEQVTESRPRIRVDKNGERVIVDPTLTVQRIYMIFYLCINIGSLSSIATTNMELHTGFWSAYLLALCMFIIGFGVLIMGKNNYILKPPKGSVIRQSFKAMWMAGRSRKGLDSLKPSVREQQGLPGTVPWDDGFVEELKRALVACKVFLFFPIYWLVYSQMMNNFVSQAATMELHGIPNDIMQNIDPITVILFIPICDRFFYPFLRRMGIQFKPITRIFWGFMMGSLAMGYAAFVQNRIYTAPPCFGKPLKCSAAQIVNDEQTGDVTILHNQVHVALQTPAYFFIALSEIFASITGLEYAYTKAPTNMKSFIMSMFLLTSAFGAALGAALAPLAHDPHLTYVYTGLAAVSFLGGCVFWALYSHYNQAEDALNDFQASSGRGERKDVGHMAVGAGEVPPSLPMTYQLSRLDLPSMKRTDSEGLDPRRQQSTTIQR